MAGEVPDLEDPERQEKLRKYLPVLWIAPLALIFLLAAIAYCGR
ncbi:MAG: hypothetical protein ACRD3V_06760 [Vicinamibacteria bacterium]